jgi:protein-S-isoprenylcysteine O-methyltransferase Ste14
VLSVLTVQIFAGIGLAATFAGILIGRLRNPPPKDPVVVVASRPPARGTQALWVGGVVVVLLWGLGVFVFPTYAYHWPAFSDFPGSWTVQIVGVGMSIAGGLLYSRAARALGRLMTPAIRVQQDHQLMQSGPYRYIRHPVYTAIIVIAIGQTLFFLSLPVAILALLLVGLAVYRARLEETLLASSGAFGATYVSYMARTGRFLPRLHVTARSS